MSFITVSDKLSKKGFTSLDNKFIIKYMNTLSALALKVYIFTIYVAQNAQSYYTLPDFAYSLSCNEDDLLDAFLELEEYELLQVTNKNPIQVLLLDLDDLLSSPKKFKAEKYTDFSKNVQSILKGRMISTNEFREYFYLLEEYKFEQDALLMIISYCVNLKGDNIRLPYIKKVAKSFADDHTITAKSVEEKLSEYTSSTSLLLRIFTSLNIKRQPDINDDKLYQKWTQELNFTDASILATIQTFKIRNLEKLDETLHELYHSKKFDIIEIQDYYKQKNSIYEMTLQIAKNLGVYMQNATPYIQTFTTEWMNFGFSKASLIELSTFCFRENKRSFEDMGTLLSSLYEQGIITDLSIQDYIANQIAEQTLLKNILNRCGLTRQVIPWDRDCLKTWKHWNFSDEMIFSAAEQARGKNNPIAYMNSILSAWKNENIFSIDQIPTNKYANTSTSKSNLPDAASVERHFLQLRHQAEDRAEQAKTSAMNDPIYSDTTAAINALSIKLAFAEIRDPQKATELSQEIAQLEKTANERLSKLGISKEDFLPHYQCTDCNDTGYTKNGHPCHCMKSFIENYRK